MPVTKRTNLKGILVIAGVTVLMAAIGFATTAQLSARNRTAAKQDPVAQGDHRGPGPMGRGMMGPGGPGMGGPGGRFGMGGLPLRELDLTDAQREQVKAIMESHRDAQQSIGDRMRTARQALQEAITADTLDESAIKAHATEIGAIEADAALLQAKVHAEVTAILTPEQVKKWKELRTELQNRMKEGGRGRGMRPHPRPEPEPRAEDGVSFPEAV